MNTLEINDIFDAYYEGRERFPHLPEPRDLAGEIEPRSEQRFGRTAIAGETPVRSQPLPLAH